MDRHQRHKIIHKLSGFFNFQQTLLYEIPCDNLEIGDPEDFMWTNLKSHDKSSKTALYQVLLFIKPLGNPPPFIFDKFFKLGEFLVFTAGLTIIFDKNACKFTCKLVDFDDSGITEFKYRGEDKFCGITWESGKDTSPINGHIGTTSFCTMKCKPCSLNGKKFQKFYKEVWCFNHRNDENLPEGICGCNGRR